MSESTEYYEITTAMQNLVELIYRCKPDTDEMKQLKIAMECLCIRLKGVNKARGATELRKEPVIRRSVRLC